MDIAGNWWLAFESVPFVPSENARLVFDAEGCVRRGDARGRYTFDGRVLRITPEDAGMPTIVGRALRSEGSIAGFSGTLKDESQGDDPIYLAREQATGFWSANGGVKPGDWHAG